MPTVKHVQIHLTEPSRTRAAEALYPEPKTSDYLYYDTYMDHSKEVLRLRAEFTGPHFHDISHVACSEGTVDVYVSDACAYMYPLTTVARIKVYTEEVPDVSPVLLPPDPDADIPF